MWYVQAAFRRSMKCKFSCPLTVFLRRRNFSYLPSIRFICRACFSCIAAKRKKGTLLQDYSSDTETLGNKKQWRLKLIRRWYSFCPVVLPKTHRNKELNLGGDCSKSWALFLCLSRIDLLSRFARRPYNSRRMNTKAGESNSHVMWSFCQLFYHCQKPLHACYCTYSQ